jgi:Peptide N-acetyl-beta-D-glucosaminyl asparaginase amidase A
MRLSLSESRSPGRREELRRAVEDHVGSLIGNELSGAVRSQVPPKRSSLSDVHRSSRVLGMLLATVTALVAAPATALAATAAAPPPEFGTSWDNPRTAGPPVPVPDTKHCSVLLVDHAFRDYSVYTNDFRPPPKCSPRWSKVVLRMDGVVAGRQFDRLGWLDVGGVRLLTTSTPEPSPAGITWHVEKDVTQLAPLFEEQRQVQMYLGNTVDETYTGVLDIKVWLDFYQPGAGQGPATTADQVLPMTGTHRDDSDLVGSLTVPRNTTRLLADVFATGSGGGCEEFWDTSAPAGTGYSCPDGLPYREVDVSIDGRIAGTALPYAVVYTGGWSNPFLWYNIPAPQAFDIPPLHYDLTPFAAQLDDGLAHDVRLSVVGLPPGQGGWTLSPRFRVWTDPELDVVTGGLTAYDAPDAVLDSTVTGANDAAGSVALQATRAFNATGWLQTSRGLVSTTVQRHLTNDSHHHWTDGEADDVLQATWRDRSSSTVTTPNDKPSVTTQDLRYAKDGTLGFHPHPGIDGAYDVTGDITITYAQDDTASRFGRSVLDRSMSDTFDGQASWIYNVPRDQRHGLASTSEHYRLTGDPDLGCYDHTLAAVNGTFTTDRIGC